MWSYLRRFRHITRTQVHIKLPDNPSIIADIVHRRREVYLCPAHAPPSHHRDRTVFSSTHWKIGWDWQPNVVLFVSILHASTASTYA